MTNIATKTKIHELVRETVMRVKGVSDADLLMTGFCMIMKIQLVKQGVDYRLSKWTMNTFCTQYWIILAIISYNLIIIMDF